MTIEDPRIYVRILHHIRAQIDDGTLAAGEPVPTISALCRQFACSRQTAARALALLAADGYLTRYPGLGYYVTLSQETLEALKAEARRRRREEGGRIALQRMTSCEQPVGPGHVTLTREQLAERLGITK